MTCTAAEAGLGEPVVVRGDWSAKLVVGAHACASRLDRGHQGGQEELAAPWSGGAGGVSSGARRGRISGPDGCCTAHHLDGHSGDGRATQETSRGAERGRLDPAKVKSLADQRAEELSKIDSEVSEASMEKSAKARDKALEAVSDATRRQAVLLARGQANGATRSHRSLTPTPARWQGLLAGHERLQHCGPLRPGRPMGALPHGLGLLLPRRHSTARSCDGRRHQRRDRTRQRLGRQLCRYQVPEWHSHADGSHVDRLGQRRPDGVGVSDRRRHRS